MTSHPERGADFNLQVTVRNARLLRAVRETFGSASECARQLGISQQSISALMTMREKPYRQDGSLTNTAEKLCGALGKYPDELWPQHIAEMQARKGRAELEVSLEDVQALQSDGADVWRRKLISEWGKGLNPRDAEVLHRRVSGQTFEEIASDLGVTRERARQRECRALRVLRVNAKRKGYESFSDVVEASKC